MFQQFHAIRPGVPERIGQVHRKDLLLLIILRTGKDDPAPGHEANSLRAGVQEEGSQPGPGPSWPLVPALLNSAETDLLLHTT